ncbi:MAG: hypothetical protein ACNI3A_01290 [Desulfovibrio sp.]|uniref:hypothetical protein n=1 Tax=Desulfovibrio sp. 7SRBS1 TaxID=3378064 RepID=UPI003B3CFCCB
MVILFPFMHPVLCDRMLLPGMRLFNPGLQNVSGADNGESNASLYFCPEELPMDTRAAGRYVRDAINFGQGYKEPRDLASLAAAGVNDFYTGTAMSILSELNAMEQGKKQDSEDNLKESLTKAQALLLFAWTFEQAQTEAVNLDVRFQEGYAKLRDTLGLNESDDDDARDLAGMTDIRPDGAGEQVRRDIVAGWRGIFEAICAFLPEDAQLAAFSPEIASDLDEYGVAATAADGHPWEGMNVRMFRAPGWQMAGRKNLPKDKPWLATERTMFLLTARATEVGESI